MTSADRTVREDATTLFDAIAELPAGYVGNAYVTIRRPDGTSLDLSVGTTPTPVEAEALPDGKAVGLAVIDATTRAVFREYHALLRTTSVLGTPGTVAINAIRERNGLPALGEADAR